MHGSQLFEMLEQLDRKAFRRFKEFVLSPYFNKNKRLHSLILEIDRYFPRLEHPALDREVIFPKLFPGEPFQEQKIYDLLTRMLRLMEKYLAQIHFEDATFALERAQLASLGERKWEKYYNKAFEKAESRLEASPLRDAEFFKAKYQLHAENDLFYVKYLKEIRRRADTSLQAAVDNLDLYYLATKFSQSCKMVNRQNVLATQYDLSGLSSAMAYYEANLERFGKVPAVSIYYTILKTLLEPEDESSYDQLLELLRTESDNFTPEEARSMYNFAENYCIKKINQGETAFEEKIYSLYRDLIKSGLLLKQGQLSQWDYKNIVSVGLRLERFSWTLDFIEKYRPYMGEDVRENAYRYNLAHYFFFVGEYSKALRLLQQVEYTDIFYELGARNTILKAFYELEETESLFSHISAFKTFLRRNKLISEYQRKIYPNLLDLVKSLYRIKLEIPSTSSVYVSSKEKNRLLKDLNVLADRIYGAESVASLPWIQSKADQLYALMAAQPDG